jgi:ribosome recycling factor
MTDPIIKAMTEKMEKSIAVFTREMASLRAGRATPQLLDRIQAEYYGTLTPIAQMANISVPEPRVLLIAPWEASMLKNVERAILKSDLGINPSNDGKAIRLVLPELTEERRKDLVKQVKKLAEECKVAVRSIRRDAVEQAKKQKKDGDMTEDDQKQIDAEIQKVTDAQIKEIDKLMSEKEKELLTI